MMGCQQKFVFSSYFAFVCLLTVAMSLSSMHGLSFAEMERKYSLPSRYLCREVIQSDGSWLATIPKLMKLNLVDGKIEWNVICRIPDCLSGPCQHGLCEEKIDDYQCHCLEGFSGKECSEDVDECTTRNSSCDITNGGCSNTIGSFTCTCNTGYEMNTDGFTCEDVNECTAGTPSCDTTNGGCLNTNGSFSCTCNSGYELNEDGITCDVSCGSFLLNFGTSYYNFSTCEVDHPSAVSACSGMESHLVFIGSRVEEDFLMSALANVTESRRYWIGLTRESPGAPISWSDGSVLTYDNTVPDAFDNGHLCFWITYPWEKWNDWPCTLKIRYICEKEIGN